MSFGYIDNLSVVGRAALAPSPTVVSITHYSETAGNVVTLTVTNNPYVAGQVLAIQGLSVATWLNYNDPTTPQGYITTIAPTNATTITFNDSTASGASSGADTGTVALTTTALAVTGDRSTNTIFEATVFGEGSPRLVVHNDATTAWTINSSTSTTALSLTSNIEFLTLTGTAALLDTEIISIQVSGGTAGNTLTTAGDTFTLSSVANHVGSNTTYTGTDLFAIATSGGGTEFTVTGFTNSNNNGTFTVVGYPTATTITLNNPNGVSETHAATLKRQQWVKPRFDGMVSSGAGYIIGAFSTLQANQGGSPAGNLLGFQGDVYIQQDATSQYGIFVKTTPPAFGADSGSQTTTGWAVISPNLSPSATNIDKTAQSAALSNQALFTTPANGAGLYRITWQALVTTAATTSSTLGGTAGFQVTYTNADTSASTTTPSAGAPTAGSNQAYSQTNQGNTVGSGASGTVIINAAASSAITYAFGYTSSGGTAMQYALHVRIEAI